MGDEQAMEQCPDHLASGHQEACWAVYVQGRGVWVLVQISLASPASSCLDG